MLKQITGFLLIVISIFTLTGCVQKEKKLNLYVCAGLKKPMDIVIEKFQQKGVKVIPNYGPSGGLYAQIKKDQPCDLYFSADWLYIEKLENEKKLALYKKFLKDDEVLVVSKSGVDKVKSLNDLTKKDIALAIADPRAPVGAYAEKALKKLGIWEEMISSGNIKARPSTVNQLAIMVKKDEVDAGIIYKSVALAYDLKQVEILSEDLTGEIIFAAGIIKDGNQKLAKEFLDFASKHINEFTKFGWMPYE